MSTVTIPIEQFASQLDDILNEYKDELIESADEAVKKAGKAGAKALQANSPRKSGGYAGGWTSQEQKTRVGSTTVIYNGKKPGLAHLLEYGHAVVRKGKTVGRANEHPHIEKIEKELVDRFNNDIRVSFEGKR